MKKDLRKIFAIILAACFLIGGMSEMDVIAASGTAKAVSKAAVKVIDTTDGSSAQTVYVPVYSGSKIVRYYIINPADARRGLQQVFDWIRYYHESEKSTAQMKVVLPKATYKIHSAKGGKSINNLYQRDDAAVSYLALYSYTTLDMTSGAVISLGRDQRSDCLMRFGRIDERAGGYNTFKNVNIIGGTLDGNDTPHPLLRFAHASDVVVRGVRFTDLYLQHHFEFAGCKNVIVNGCTFDNYHSDDLSSGNNHEALQIDVLTPSAFPGAGKGGYDGTCNTNITVKNCTFKHCKRGIGTHTGIVGLYQTNIVIKNNTFTNCIGYGIASINWRKAHIFGNRISGGRGIYFKHLSGSNHRKYMPNRYNGKTRIIQDVDSSIENNVINVIKTEEPKFHFGIATYGEVIKKNFAAKDSKGETTYIDDDGNEKAYGFVPAGDYRVKNLTIRANTINLSSKSQGIWLKGTVSSTVSSNKITNRVKQRKDNTAIRDVKGKKNKILDNSITDSKNTINGVTLENTSKTKVSKNSIKKLGGYGVRVYSKSSGINVSQNVIKSTANNGIRVFAKSHADKITLNEITGCRKEGILLDTKKKSKTKIYGNILKKCADNKKKDEKVDDKTKS